MNTTGRLSSIEEIPGFKLRNGLSIAASAAVSFLILFGIIQAQKTEIIDKDTTFEELRSVVLPAPPPPLPQVQQPVEAAPSLVELDATPLDSTIKVSYSVSQVAPAIARPTASPVFDFSPDAFRPGLGDYQSRHVYNKSEVDQAPVIVYKKVPEYNFKMMGKNRSTRIRLMYIVNTKGTVEAVGLVGSGGEEFDKVVMEAVRQWRFKPAIKDGKKVDCWVRQRVILKKGQGQSRFSI